MYVILAYLSFYNIHLLHFAQFLDDLYEIFFNSPYIIFLRYFGTKTIWYVQFQRGRVGKGNLTPSLSRNRT